MSNKTYEITVPVLGGRYETQRTDRIDQLIQVKIGWHIGIAYGRQVEYYFLDAGSTIRTPEGKLYDMDKFPMLAELIILEKSLEAL